MQNVVQYVKNTCYICPFHIPLHDTRREVMSSPVTTLRCTENLSTIACILNDPKSYNGFPVVEDYDPDVVRYGVL